MITDSIASAQAREFPPSSRDFPPVAALSAAGGLSAPRSRIDGNLYRSVDDLCLVRRSPGAADDPEEEGLLRLEVSFSSEVPVLRNNGFEDPWVEILGHRPSEIDLSRLQNRAAVLANHERYSNASPLTNVIGVVERAWLEDGRGKATIALSRRQELAGLRQDIADGIVHKISVGYQINERVLTRSPKDAPAEYRVTQWAPFEISLVDIPADDSVGVGRSHPASPAPAAYRVIPLGNPQQSPPISPPQNRTRTMETPDPAVDQKPTLPPPAGAIRLTQDALAEERKRALEISALAKAHGMEERGRSAIESGLSLESFSAQVFAALRDTGKIRLAESPEVGMSDKEIASFSFRRAILAAQDPVAARQIAPLEYEASLAAQAKRSGPRPERGGAITIPPDVLARGIFCRPEEMAGAMGAIRQAFSGREVAYRDMTVGSATGGGNTVGTDLLGSDFISLLRNAMVLDRLGVKFLRDLNGNVAIPSHTAATTGYWVAENGAPTESAPTVGQVTLSPNTAAAWCDYGRRLLLQSSIDVEAFVRADLAAVLSQMIQAAAINGAGSDEPLGILGTSGIGSVAGGTDGLAPTYDHIVGLESAVANANADVGTLAFLTNTKVRGKLRRTQQFSGTDGKPVFTSGREAGLGDLLGYDAWVTNSVPSTLTKGSSGAVCSAIIFGNFSDLIIGFWGGLDILYDPFSLSTTGARRLVAIQEVDVAVARAASFAAMKDALTT